MIPLPSSIDNHQFYNAKHIEKINMGFIHEQKDGFEDLSSKLEEIFNQKTYNKWKNSQNNDHLLSAANIANQVIEKIEVT